MQITVLCSKHSSQSSMHLQHFTLYSEMKSNNTEALGLTGLAVQTHVWLKKPILTLSCGN